MILPHDYKALFAASPYPYLLVDTAYVIIGANPAYLRATCRTAADLVGKNIFDAFPGNPADPDSTNLEEVRASIALAISTRRPHTSALLRYGIPRETPDGIVFEDRYWSAIHSPVFDSNGTVSFVSQNALDVTDLYRFDSNSRKYYLRQDVHVVDDLQGQQERSQMHEAMTRILSSERNQMQTLFDQAPGFIAVLNGADHTVELVNQAYYHLVGRRKLIGKPVIEAMTELADAGFKELLDRVFGTGEGIVLRSQKVLLQRVPNTPLEERFVDLLCQPIRGADGRVTGIFVQGNDVTNEHQANMALADKVEQLELVRQSQAFQLELADRIRLLSSADEVTDAACELLGQALNVSRVLYAEVDDSQQALVVRRNWTAPGAESLTGQVLRMDDFGPALVAQMRAGNVTANDEVTRDERTAQHTATYQRIGVSADLLLPLVRAGRFKVLLAVQSIEPRTWQAKDIRIAQDMAERMWSAVEATQAQAALRSQRDESQYIFDSMAEGFAVLDSEWTIMRMNAEGLRLSQKSAADVVGRNHWDVFPELKGTDTEAMYERIKQTGKTEVVELPYGGTVGKQTWVEIRAHPTQQGGIAFFFREITERRLAEDASKMADRRKDEFLAMLAHELRNPLAPIGAAAQILQLGKLDDARVRHTSQVIARQVKHMTHLIDDLLDVSRVTRGLVTLDNELQDIRHIVAEAVEQATPLIQARNHHMTVLLPPDSIMVKGDASRLVQVITNILNNAAKYTNAGGNILLEIEVRDVHVLVRVIDNGIGMSPDLAERAFDLFAQAERASDRSAGGLGLGLALVKSLVELHHGTVHCESAGLGLGSTFTIYLPRIVTEYPSGEPSQDTPMQIPPGRPLRVLIVDDNVDAGTMLAMLLEASGHHVSVELSSLAALARAPDIEPDVCLLDIGLPEMDGIELARRLRQHPATAHSMLVAVTGYGQENDRRQTESAGFDHHLVKPLDVSTLSGLLANWRPAVRLELLGRTLSKTEHYSAGRNESD